MARMIRPSLLPPASGCLRWPTSQNGLSASPAADITIWTISAALKSREISSTLPRVVIPRRKGEFYWRQFAIFRELGIRTVFVGMFDEVDEVTAIYKVASQTPVGKYFVTYD